MKYDCLSGNYEPTYKQSYRMKKNLIIVILFVSSFLFVSNVTEWFSHPMIKETKNMTKEQRTDYFNNLNHEQYVTYSVEYGSYVTLKFQIYSVLFFLPILYMVFTGNKMIKIIATFALFISFASMFDKIILNIYQFKATDWIVIGAGILGGLYVHLRTRD